MAKLFSEKNDTYLQLSLFKLKDDEKWISYELVISIKKDIENKNFEEAFKLSESKELYLDAFYDPEVPAICSGFENLLAGNAANFIFTPADEKDFFLELKKQDQDYFLDISSNRVVLFRHIIWKNSSPIGIKIKTTKEKISQFVNELQQEYAQLMN